MPKKPLTFDKNKIKIYVDKKEVKCSPAKSSSIKQIPSKKQSSNKKTLAELAERIEKVQLELLDITSKYENLKLTIKERRDFDDLIDECLAEYLSDNFFKEISKDCG